MGLFTPSYLKDGPGVSPDAPRKKGFARLWEVLGRDFTNLYLAGVMAMLSALPFLLLLAIANASNAVLPALLGGLVGGMLAAPQLSGLADTVLRALRDEPGFWWATYRRAWKQNAKASLAPGALFGLVLAMQLFTWNLMDETTSPVFRVLLIVGVVLITGIGVYVFAQIPLMDLPLVVLLKNAVLLFLGRLNRSAMALAAILVYGVLCWLFFPLSTAVLVLTNFWVPGLLALMGIYPALNDAFDIENRINALREQELSGSSPSQK